jgi:very-short-patch-repair endonuclease
LIEYDGAWHWQQRAADERRREALRDLGWKVLVVTSDDYYRTPERVVAKVRDALAAARA